MSHSMKIRDWEQADMEKLVQFHLQMSPGYKLPESFGPLFCIRKSVVDENGRVVGMATVKLIGEAYLFLDETIPMISRAKAVKMLNDSCAEAAKTLGLEDVSAWIPPKFVKCFKSALKKLGWRKSPWRPWSFLVQ